MSNAWYTYHVLQIQIREDGGKRLGCFPFPFSEQYDELHIPDQDRWLNGEMKRVGGSKHFALDGHWSGEFALDQQSLITLFADYGWEHYAATSVPAIAFEDGPADDGVEVFLYFRKRLDTE